MAYEVPASKASIKQNQFEFKVPGERKMRSLPLLQYMPIGFRTKMGTVGARIKAAQDAGTDPAREDLVELGGLQLEMLEKFSPGLDELLDSDQLGGLLKAWTEASGVTLGE